MDDLTPKQSALLQYIYHYRYENGRTPALKEMVSELGVSDNKSLLRMIDSLVDKGYLNKETGKTRSVTLSDSGYQLVSTIPIRYEKSFGELDKVGLPAEFDRTDVSVSLPTSNHINFQGKELDASGTNSSVDLDAIIESAVYLAVNKHLNGTQPAHDVGRGKNRNVMVNVIKNALSEAEFMENAKWVATLILLTLCFKVMAGDILTAFFYSIFGAIIISYISRKQP